MITQEVMELVDKWYELVYQLVLARWVYAAGAAILAAALVFVLMHLWGWCWNRSREPLTKLRLHISALSILAGCCLGSLLPMHMCKSFEDNAEELYLASPDEESVAESSSVTQTPPPPADKPAALVLVQKISQELDDKTSKKNTVITDETPAQTYSPSYAHRQMFRKGQQILWSIFGCCIAGLLTWVAWASYTDIKEYKPI